MEESRSYSSMDSYYHWFSSETNQNGLTWPQWFYAAGIKCKYSFAVDLGWSPVIEEHAKFFQDWKDGIDPTEYRKPIE